VESEPGCGTTFHLYFPITGKVVFFDETESVEENLPGGVENILFIDDEPSLAMVGKELLEKFGYRVDIETSSIKALEKFRQNSAKFDMVITDQTMPDMTGDELSASILSINPDIPIILCSGYSTRINKEKSRQIGIMAFVSKPVKKEELLPLIRKLLDAG
jgi:CheY-like chemotaxis protein